MADRLGLYDAYEPTLVIKGEFMGESFIGYARVSTGKQFISGLSLEHQEQVIERHVTDHKGQLVKLFIECETGRKSDNKRPALRDALALCRRTKSTLLVASLSRLSRNVAFTATLMEAGVKFVAIDAPHATPLVLHVMSAFNQYEVEQVSIRTKNALAAARQRGVKLGSYGKILAAHNKDAAYRFLLEICPQIRAIKAEGYHTSQSIANELNKRQISTFRGGSTKWYQPQVHRLLKRMDALAA